MIIKGDVMNKVIVRTITVIVVLIILFYVGLFITR